ncbi:MAG: hypothetical protein HZB20_12605, partial [Chloroflexi bacterium]|nr:hypothetical protein [Chloroflexota bacterium]
MNSDSRSQTHAGLPQPRLIVARMVWAVVAGLALTIFALSQPTFIDRVRSIHLDLAELGLSLDFALPYFLILNAAPLLTFSLVAGVIFWRKSDEWIALLTSLTLLTFPLFATPSVSIFASEQRAWMLLANGMSGLGQGLFILLLYLFPNGQFAPRWARVPVIGWAALAVVVLTFSDLSTSQVSLPIVLVILIGYGTGVFAQFYRYRRVSGLVERQQTKWIVLGLMATITVILFGFALFRIGAIGLFGGLVLFLVAVGSLLLIPLSIGISILRYRLFEIDFLINRTLVYGARP